MTANPSYLLSALARQHPAPGLRMAKVLRLLAPLLLGTALLVVGLTVASAQAGDPPGRVARLNLVEGAVSFAPADSGGDTGWTSAVPNRPLTGGDRIWTAPRSRSELHLGATTLRLGEQTSLDFLALGDDATQLRLAQGTLQLRVRNVYEGQRFEVNTPNLALVITEAGDYRVDADPGDNSTRVVVHAGRGTAYGDSGTAMDLEAGQQATFTGTQLAAGGPPPRPDDFDAWAAGRDQIEERSVSARYVPREVVGYQQLDAYGDWQQDAAYGAVWLPRAVPSGWAPYRAGHWSWIAPWGWTWIDDAPWGFAPFHYGRWAQFGPRWGWVPGRLAQRPVYAPALVAFIGGHSGGAGWNVAIGPDRRPQPAFGWFPLAPGEVFRPGYRVSPRYISSVNPNLTLSRLAGDDERGHRYQRRPEAVSVARAEDFTRGRSAIRASTQLVGAGDLGRSRVALEATAMPPQPEPQRNRGDVNLPRRPSASALPPPAVTARPVIASEFGRDRARFTDPGARRNPDAGRPGAPAAFERDASRADPQAETDKRHRQINLQALQEGQERQERRERQRAEQAQQRAQPQPQPQQQQQQQPPMQRQQQVNRHMEQERQDFQRAQQIQRQAQQQAQRNAQQQEQARRQQEPTVQQQPLRAQPAPPFTQPPGQARQRQPDPRGDERRERRAPGWEQR